MCRATEGSSRAVLLIQSDLTYTAQINNAKTYKMFQEFKSENTFEKIAMTVHKTSLKPRSHNCVMSLRLRLPRLRSHNCADQPRYREGFLARPGESSRKAIKTFYSKNHFKKRDALNLQGPYRKITNKGRSTGAWSKAFIFIRSEKVHVPVVYLACGKVAAVNDCVYIY